MSKQLQIFLTFTAAYFLSYFYRSANAVIAPDLSRDLSLSAEQLGLMTSLFFGAFALIQIPLGIGLDKWGPRWVTSGLMLVGVVGSLVFAMAPSFLVLTLGRALIGIGMAGILMGSLKIFSQWFSAQRFATVSSLLVGIGSSGALVAATPLAWLNNTVGWRSVFLAGAVITAVVAAVIGMLSRNTPPGVPWPGGSGMDNSFKTIFADLRFWRIAPLTFFTTGTLLSFQGLWAGPFLFDIMRLNEIAAGNILLLMGIGTTIGFAASGWLADRLGLSQVAVISAAASLVSQLLLMFQPPLAVVRLLYLLFGFSGAFNIVLLAQVRRLFPESITGQAVTAVNLFGIGGTFLLQWWLGLIIGSFTVDSAGHYPLQAYIAALSFTAVGLLISLVWYFPMIRTGGVVEAGPIS